ASKPVLAGMVLGIVSALALGRFLSGMLYQVTPHDPASMAATVLVISAAAFVAVLVPARRATRVDPVVSLR
ncbi:MAG TPA: hypothetical protein VJ921_01560, partial [Vicinamibacteria bacterium]|nr:hypothetical protein [Vicinamibacteria bacterium]